MQSYNVAFLDAKFRGPEKPAKPQAFNRYMNIRIEQEIFLRASENDRDKTIWFVHGFAESGFSFVDLFHTSLGDHFNMLVPDFPGFGVTPLSEYEGSLREAGHVLLDLIDRVTPEDGIYLVGHSLGSVICTEAAQSHDRVVAVASIEGNLTEADAYFSGRATKYETGTAFKDDFLKDVMRMAQDNEALQRYYTSVRLANPTAMMRWGQASTEVSKEDVSGSAFKNLRCPTLYYWGADSTPVETQRYVDSAGIRNRRFKDSGHWPMVDIPDQCARDLQDFFLSI